MVRSSCARGCRDLWVEWRAGDAPHAKAVVGAWRRRRGRRERRGPAPPGRELLVSLAAGRGGAKSEKRLDAGRDQRRAAAHRAGRVGPSRRPSADDGPEWRRAANLALARRRRLRQLIIRRRPNSRALHGCLSGLDVCHPMDANARRRRQKHRRLQNGPVRRVQATGARRVGIALFKEDASWTPPSAPSTSR